MSDNKKRDKLKNNYMSSVRPHLLLVHSFPTNSVLLHGLQEFLSDFFTVHFIDLPGFHESVPPLTDKITITRFSNYFDKKIQELDVKEYVVGGISFGFLVVNNAKLDKRCKGVLAMEPFINTECLSISYFNQKKFQVTAGVLQLVQLFSLERKIWQSNWFNNYLQKSSDYPKDRVDVIIQHLDPKTFFSVTRILLNYKVNPVFHKLPHFLVGNFADTTIDFNKVVEVFLKNLDELHIASEPIDHYPKELTKHYFKSRIPHEHIERMLACMNGE